MKFTLLGQVAAGRDNNFNLLRFVAASLVLISHSFALVFGTDGAEPLRHSLGISLGSIAVDIFFAISGFLVTGSLLYRQNLIEFVTARALRIYPGLWVALILTVVIVGLNFSTLTPLQFFSEQKTWLYFWRNASMIRVDYFLPGVFNGLPLDNSVNGSLWTLPLEIKMYLSLAAIWIASKVLKFSPVKTFSIICVFLGVSGTLYVISTLLNNTHPASAAALGSMFFFGSALKILQNRVVLSKGIFFSCLFVVLTSAFVNQYIFNVIYRLVLPYLILYIAFIPSGRVRQFNQLGDYSYGIYIYAWPIQQAVLYTWKGLSVYQHIGLSFTITLMFAIASWHSIERPALELKSKLKPIVRYGE